MQPYFSSLSFQSKSFVYGGGEDNDEGIAKPILTELQDRGVRELGISNGYGARDSAMCGDARVHDGGVSRRHWVRRWWLYGTMVMSRRSSTLMIASISFLF